MLRRDCCNASYSRRHSGAPQGEPGIHTPEPVFMDSGFALRYASAPRNDGCKHQGHFAAITFMPPMYDCNASGTAIEPSAC
jgi:hypothetical protein